MSILGSLKPAEGSTHYQKRLGRGRGSGLGQTSGKGHKGQIARSGGKVRRGFEGGQTPLMRRLPKFGFTNAAFANEYEIVNLSTLNKLDSKYTNVDADLLISMGIVGSARFKVLASGELTRALNVTALAFSATAAKKIEAAGGKVTVVK